ncbi:Rieske (2Fe-2S) protein [Planctomicrobium sp. SH668]|uniref:Rieske (2Fe-2S) protein n=1 Tax=Planctomicrobium sp. SH668 TaxID=3448126 RepID=UPI003F5CAF82
MWHRLISRDELPSESGKEFVIGDRIIALFHSDGEIYAMDGICPHAGGPLGEGAVQQGIVTCPWHGWQFEIKSGQSCLTSQIRQKCFPVNVEDGVIFVELP